MSTAEILATYLSLVSGFYLPLHYLLRKLGAHYFVRLFQLPLRLAALDLATFSAYFLLRHSWPAESLASDTAHLLLLLSTVGAVLTGVSTAVYDVYLTRLRHVQVPHILRIMINALFYVLVLMAVLKWYFHYDVSGVFLTSAAVSFVLGIALQDVLVSLFAGVSLSIEGTFKLGDFIDVAGLEGIVVETDWRSTTIITRAQDYITIPNRRITESPVTNYYQPQRLHRITQSISLDLHVPPGRAKEVLLAAIHATPEILASPAPDVLHDGYDQVGICYQMRFFVADYARRPQIEDQLRTALWYRLHRAHITIPYPNHMINMVQDRVENNTDVRDIKAVLAAVPLFATLKPADRQHLASLAEVALYGNGEVLFRAGDPGDSFYIVKSGCIEISFPGTAPSLPETLGPGTFFGERSLLTGENRSATAVVRNEAELVIINKSAFQEILLSDPAIVENLGTVLLHLAERDGRRVLGQAGHSSSRLHDEHEKNHLLLKIRHFFGVHPSGRS